MLHCSSPLPTKILQSCSVILQNVPLMSARVLISICILFTIAAVYMFMYVYQQPMIPIHWFLLFYITVIATIYSLSLVLQIVLYIAYTMNFSQKFKTCKSPITTNEAVRTSFTAILTKCFNNTKHHS